MPISSHSSYCDPEIKIHLNGPLTVYQRQFLELGGSIHASLMLSQALYWSERTSDPGGWFYKTQREWFSEIGFSRRELEKCRRQLRQAGVLEEKRAGLPARLYYRVNKERLKGYLTSLNRPDCSKCANLIAQPEQTSLSAPRTHFKDYCIDYHKDYQREPAGLSPGSAGDSSPVPAGAAPEPAPLVETPMQPSGDRVEGAGEPEPVPPVELPAPAQGEEIPPAGDILAELETMAAGITAAATQELQRPAAADAPPPADPLPELLPANDPVRLLADEYTRLLLVEFDAGYETFRRRRLDLEASRTGLRSAVVEQPEKYRRIRDRRLYVRKWLLNERARLPV